jgi:hypothetical protein
MKVIFTLTLAVLTSFSVYSQRGIPLTHEDSMVLAEAGGGQRLPVDTGATVSGIPVVGSFHGVIDTVLRDFPNNLRNITGELVLAQGEFENYASMVVLPGAENCTITRWHSIDDTTASWQAKMFTSEDFEAASKQYHELFRQLQRCYLKLVDGSMIYLNGDWEPAKEEAAFTTSTLRLLTGDSRYREVKVEVELVYLFSDWAVRVNIVSKKRDDRVGGSDDAGR